MDERIPHAIVPVVDGALLPLGEIADQARDFIAAAKAPNTLRAYRADWQHFTGWCARHGLPSLPSAPETVALYLSAYAGHLKTSTLQRRISAISQAHQAAGYESPTRSAVVRTTFAGIRRTLGTAAWGKAPMMTEHVRLLVNAQPDAPKGIRDRALLLLGFAGAFRRSELVSLDVADLQFTAAGLVVMLRRSKTDQEGEGRKIGIPKGAQRETCPVRSLQLWLKVARLEEGPVFRRVDRHGNIRPDRLTAQSVALVVKTAAEVCGLDPDEFAGHSLRSGLATSAAAAGVSERAIMNQTGHRSVTMVRKYIREGSLFRENAAGLVGL